MVEWFQLDFSWDYLRTIFFARVVARESVIWRLLIDHGCSCSVMEVCSKLGWSF